VRSTRRHWDSRDRRCRIYRDLITTDMVGIIVMVTTNNGNRLVTWKNPFVKGHYRSPHPFAPEFVSSAGSGPNFAFVIVQWRLADGFIHQYDSGYYTPDYASALSFAIMRSPDDPKRPFSGGECYNFAVRALTFFKT
jgi:hypothetical protein